jgi:hypothetical protein
MHVVSSLMMMDGIKFFTTGMLCNKIKNNNNNHKVVIHLFILSFVRFALHLGRRILRYYDELLLYSTIIIIYLYYQTVLMVVRGTFCHFSIIKM